MSKILTDAQILSIENRCASATKGPWVVLKMKELFPERHPSDERYCCVVSKDPTAFIEGRFEDANFKAQARTDIPLLLEELRRLRALLDRKPEGGKKK